MFEGFTQRARSAVGAAVREARDLHHHDVGTGVMLLVLTREEAGTSARALGSLGITEEAARQQIRELIATGQPIPPLVQLPLSPHAKQALELSPREASKLGQPKADTGHLLLGLLDIDTARPRRS